MTDEIAPCPFCMDGGNPFPYVDRQTKMGYAIKCYTCHAQGPIVLFETDHKHTWEETTKPAIEAATVRWNDWMDICAPCSLPVKPKSISS